MNYFIDLFSPETARAFTNSNQDTSGFRISRKTYVENHELPNYHSQIIIIIIYIVRSITIMH